MASLHVPRIRSTHMPNERLRASLLEHGLTPVQLGDRLGVDHKTVERWIAGRLPYRKYRFAIASQLGLDEGYLWPDALSREQVAAASEGELLAIYPHRSDVPRALWERLFSEAKREIGVLVYSGLFLSEDTVLKNIISDRARSGARVRFLLGDPDCEQVAIRGADEGVDDLIGMKIRNALVQYRKLMAIDGVEFRFHQTILYNSIYIGDESLLVNTHLYGLPAAAAPVWHMKKLAGGEIAAMYLESFERVWEAGSSLPLA
jgi:transcriptional regulator with XRE-family HTH domain